jgi:hypothetical protein
MINRNPDPDPGREDKPRGKAVYPASHDNRDPAPDNDNGGGAHPNQAIAPTLTTDALAALTSLSAMLNAVDITGVAGRSGLPMLLFKSRENNGTWSFGQLRTVPEADSTWAVNPRSFMRGYICFDSDNKPTERLASISQPMIDIAELPDLGFAWQEQWTVNLRCLNGADTGAEVVFKASTVGGTQAVAVLLEAIRDRLNSGQHNGEVVPIVSLEKSSYPHPEHGKTWFPILAIADWMPIDGPAVAPAPTPAPPPPAPEPSRRRRVG